MELKYVENIDKHCRELKDCEKCPFNDEHYTGKAAYLVNRLCHLSGERLSFRELIEEVQKVTLPSKIYQRYYYLITNNKKGYNNNLLYLTENEKNFYLYPSWRVFNTKVDADNYLKNHSELENCKVVKIDTNEVCLSGDSCDDCGWSGNCPRHHEKCWDDK